MRKLLHEVTSNLWRHTSGQGGAAANRALSPCRHTPQCGQLLVLFLASTSGSLLCLLPPTELLHVFEQARSTGGAREVRKAPQGFW